MWIELFKFVTTIAAALLGGWIALQQLTHEYRLAIEREARAELVKRFVNDTDDLNDVFRAVAFLVRSGMVGDSEGRLRAEVQRHFAQPLDEIALNSIVIRASAANVPTLPPARPVPSGVPPRSDVDPGPIIIVPGSTRGSVLAASVDRLNDSTPSVRRATAQGLVDVLRGTTAVEAVDKRRLAETLVDMLTTSRLRGLSAEGRLNVIHVLSEVPDSSWQEWSEIREELRARLQELEERRQKRQTMVGAETLGRINVLRQSLQMPAVDALRP